MLDCHMKSEYLALFHQESWKTGLWSLESELAVYERDNVRT